MSVLCGKNMSYSWKCTAWLGLNQTLGLFLLTPPPPPTQKPLPLSPTCFLRNTMESWADAGNGYGRDYPSETGRIWMTWFICQQQTKQPMFSSVRFMSRLLWKLTLSLLICCLISLWEDKVYDINKSVIRHPHLFNWLVMM